MRRYVRNFWNAPRASLASLIQEIRRLADSINKLPPEDRLDLVRDFSRIQRTVQKHTPGRRQLLIEALQRRREHRWDPEVRNARIRAKAAAGVSKSQIEREEKVSRRQIGRILEGTPTPETGSTKPFQD
jgi:hypothetical protein